MVPEDPQGFWLPAPGESAALPDLDNPQQLGEAILNVAFVSDQEVDRLVTHLVNMGQPYQAARCLEIVAQRRMGLDFTGDELTGHEDPSFGAFHGLIYDMLRSGALYHRARRPRTSEATFRRALIFVEEAIRHMQRPEDESGDVYCMGLAFELAGHCAAALDDTTGLEYYLASERFWSQAARMRPEVIGHWTHHPVTQKVIRCLTPVVETRQVPEEAVEGLFTPDYLTRLESAKALLR